MKKLLIYSLFFSLSFTSLAQESACACCTPAHDEFDYWLGDWEVFNSAGIKIGENHIEKLEGNCLVSENWQSLKGSSGKSFNYFDPSDETWNQLWISSNGNILELKGTLENNGMVLRSRLSKTAKGPVYNQISLDQE